MKVRVNTRNHNIWNFKKTMNFQSLNYRTYMAMRVEVYQLIINFKNIEFITIYNHKYK